MRPARHPHLQETLRRLGRHDERLARFVYQTGLSLRVARAKPVVVYSPGKTGSTSVDAAIRGATGRPVLHAHRTTPVAISAARRTRVAAGAPVRSVPDWRGDIVRHLIEHDPRGCDIVSITRDPVARAVSAFFHAAPAFGYLDGLSQGEPSREADLLDAITGRFLASHVHPASMHWFNWELARATGIDVCRMATPGSGGARQFSNRRTRLLVIRYEDLNSRAPATVAEFLGVEDLQIPQLNVSSKKRTGALYELFRNSAVLPDWYLTAMFQGRATRSFYTPEEIAGFRASWMAR